jgi:hypothetical protein
MRGDDCRGPVTDVGDEPHRVGARGPIRREGGPVVNALSCEVRPLDESARQAVDEVEDQHALVDPIGIRRTVVHDLVEHACAAIEDSERMGPHRVDRGEELLLGAVLAGEIRPLDASTIHSVQATGGRYLGAVHVYGGDLLVTPRCTWRDGVEQPNDESALPAFFERLRAHEDALGRAMTAEEVTELLSSPAPGPG